MMQHASRMKMLGAIVVLGMAVGPIAAHASEPERKPAATTVTLKVHAEPAGGDEDQADDHLFDVIDKIGAKAKESNEVNLDKSMLGLAARKGGEKGDLASKLDYIVVREYGFAHEGEYNLDDLKPVFKRLDGDGWKHLVRSREDKEMTDICVRQDSEGLTKEMVIISAEPKELSLVHLKGNVTVADLKNLGGVVGGAAAKADGSGDPKLNHH